MKRSVLILSAFLLILASCRKKEYPQNVSENPEFYVSATIDNAPVMLQAGTMGYYMYSSYSQNNDGIYSFIADVKPNTCAGTCPNSLRIELHDNIMASQGAASNINNSVKTGSYTYVNSNTSTPTLIGYMVSYGSSFNLPSATYDWNFGVGSNSVTANPTHTYSAPGVYNTKLTATGTGSPPIGVIENPVKVTLNTNVCRTRIIASVNGNTVQFGHQTTGSDPQNYIYNWKFGDGSMPSPDETPTHVYPPIIPGQYTATLTVIDTQHQDTAYHHYNLNINQNLMAAPNFWVNSVNGIYSNSPLSKIKITYTDGSGKVYTSDVQPQNGSNFQIVSVEDYKNNENGQRTKKLKITFSCRLYNDSSAVTITNGEAVIAVAYK